MRQRNALRNALVLTLFGTALATSCVVSSSDGTDDDDGGSGGFGNSSSKGGSTAKGGSSGKGGSSSSAGESSTGGDTGTVGGSNGGGGTPATDDAVCDQLDTGGQGGGTSATPYPSCDPVDPDNTCETCIQEKCCEESKNCNAFDPKNVCGYGGPSEYQNNGGEFLCWQECINEKVEISAGGAGQGGGSGLPDTVSAELSEECFLECATPADFGPGCDGLPGGATNEITTCVFDNCGDGICFH